MLYIHIPFCKQLCAYCDFHFSVSLEWREQLVRALLCEMEERSNYLPAPLLPATLYIGGGTPSALPPAELRGLIEKAGRLFTPPAFSEITVEINPDDSTPAYLSQLYVMGVTRLSIGVQSFHDRLLQLLRRRHSAQQAITCVKTAQAAGFKNITIDLMYGLPQQTPEEWRQDVAQALSLHVPHISAYHLSIEPKTLFGKQHAKGTLLLPDEETGAQQFLYLHHTLEKAGYEHYEISNFARNGFRAEHNSGYWQGFPYLGIGPSAHSYNGQSRQWNIANNRRYVASIENRLPAFEMETLTTEMRFNEYLLTSLRTAAGADLQYLSKTFGEPFLQHCLQQAQRYLAAGDLLRTGNRLHIPPHRFLLADAVIRELFSVRTKS
ncbi:MAG: radical SAM family heme chaperone HemW [Prevotellaceae bacterium]|jgi:oxygen-independent coproporphyrinogen-3 oxidase|nr:radical SAM family heme chaperone HemW [Prevotellaceae bacterium]